MISAILHPFSFFSPHLFLCAVSPVEVNITEGPENAFQCKAKANPNATVTWSRYEWFELWLPEIIVSPLKVWIYLWSFMTFMNDIHGSYLICRLWDMNVVAIFSVPWGKKAKEFINMRAVFLLFVFFFSPLPPLSALLLLLSFLSCVVKLFGASLCTFFEFLNHGSGQLVSQHNWPNFLDEKTETEEPSIPNGKLSVRYMMDSWNKWIQDTEDVYIFGFLTTGFLLVTWFIDKFGKRQQLFRSL